jgi:diguanylate cyclase (GGDEF)-like protein/PAS domain S-box-containing protein
MNGKSIKRLLLVEDNLGDARLLREMLKEEGSYSPRLTHVERVREAERHLAKQATDIIVVDLGLSDAQGLGAVRRVQAAARRVPLVVLTGLDDESLATQALQEGAQDYLVKGQIEARGLMRALRYAVERKSMEETLYAAKERAQVTLNSIGDAVACTDNLGMVTFLNTVAERMTGWSLQEAEGRPIGEVFRIVGDTSRAPLSDSTKAGVGPSLHLQSNAILVRRDGFEVPVEESVGPIHDRERRPSGQVIVFRDVSAARAMVLQMAHSAQHDFLTGLPNRMFLTDRVNHAIALAERHGKKVAVLFLDLDGFKCINDSLGHSAGDKLLQSIAKRLLDCVRSTDTVSRQGGDEFVVLLSEVEARVDAAIAARRMLQAVAETHSIAQTELRISTSIGVSIYPDDGGDAETLVKNADTAMYRAKEGGRETYRFFKRTSKVRTIDQESVEETVADDSVRGEFALQCETKG